MLRLPRAGVAPATLDACGRFATAAAARRRRVAEVDRRR